MTNVLIHDAGRDVRQPPFPVPRAAPVAAAARSADDIVDQWGRESFPASDPPANW